MADPSNPNNPVAEKIATVVVLLLVGLFGYSMCAEGQTEADPFEMPRTYTTRDPETVRHDDCEWMAWLRDEGGIAVTQEDWDRLDCESLGF